MSGMIYKLHAQTHILV